MKECIRCHKIGKWVEDMCGKCRDILHYRALNKSPHPYFHIEGRKWGESKKESGVR